LILSTEVTEIALDKSYIVESTGSIQVRSKASSSQEERKPTQSLDEIYPDFDIASGLERLLYLST